MQRAISLSVWSILFLACLSTTAHARTFVIPHFVETAGNVAIQPGAWDTVLYAFYSSGIGPVPTGGGATLDLYLYDDTGAVLESALATPVCDPCSFTLGTRNLKEELEFDALIANAGGGSYPQGLASGWAIVQVSGDADAVSLQALTLNHASGPADIRTYPTPMAELFKGSGVSSPTAWVLPHALDLLGSILNSTDTYDTQIHLSYAAGRAGVAAGAGCTVDIYLYEQDTEDLVVNDSAVPVCAPCTIIMDDITPKVSVDLETQIRDANGGNYTNTLLHKTSVLMLLSGDADGMTIGAETFNVRSGPNDLLVVPLAPSAVDVPVPTAVVDGFPRQVRLDTYPNPTSGQTTIHFETPFAGAGTLEVFDLRGRLVTTLVSAQISSGPQSVIWDGRDARGIPVGSGTYLVRLRRGPWVRQAKIAVMR